MDDGLLVTNLVYFGTLVIGGIMLVVVAIALLGTMLMAAVAQIGALLVKLGGKLFVYHPEQTTTAPDRMEDHVRNAVVAKADAILAGARGQESASAGATSSTAETSSTDATSSTAGTSLIAEMAVPEKLVLEKPVLEKPVVEKPSLTLAYSDRTGPFTSPQPLIKAG